MKKVIIITLVSTLAGFFILAGCSTKSTSSDTESSQLNMDDFFGGYSPSDEAVAFGDEEIESDFPGTEDGISPDLNGFENLNTIQSEPDVLVYSLRILWGMLEYDSTVTSLTDWSGSLSIDTGCIKVIDKIMFERGQDHFVRPRESCKTLEWVSYTSTHYDGIQVYLYFRPSSVDTATAEVRFETGPYSRTFTLTELDSLSEIVTVDDLGNQVSIDAEKLVKMECPGGYLEGRWITLGNGRFKGQFYGQFISEDGLFMGHVKGHWGEKSDDNEQLFFGKWIDPFGHFKGFLRGNWGYDDTADVYGSSGWYEGNYFDANANNLGTLQGNWVSHHRGSMPNSGATDKVPKHARGFFHGTWKQYCN